MKPEQTPLAINWANTAHWGSELDIIHYGGVERVADNDMESGTAALEVVLSRIEAMIAEPPDGTIYSGKPCEIMVTAEYGVEKMALIHYRVPFREVDNAERA